MGSWAEDEGEKRHPDRCSDPDFDPIKGQILNILGFMGHRVSRLNYLMQGLPLIIYK